MSTDKTATTYQTVNMMCRTARCRVVAGWKTSNGKCGGVTDGVVKDDE